MIDPKELRRVLGHFATGVTIVTTRDDAGRPYGLTANAFTSLSLDPPLVLVCIDRNAETFPHFLTSKHFVVNVLADTQEELSSRFARSGGDKFAGMAYRTTADGAPILPDTIASLECRIVATHDGGDHVIHVGQVDHVAHHPGRPLLFFQGRYGRLAGD